ncbi:MAG: aldo/keto reductase [Peptococcaceae bacterium]|nr:aldo/keto reductase [Peptococcaceae bacterium]
MQYRPDKKGRPVSILGYGCLRFTKTAGRVDLIKAEEEIMAAVRAGVNYFDTAYVYPGSEAALGRILEKNRCREKVMIATKLPHYLVKSREGLEKLFLEELRRLRTDYVDYYLMHMLTDLETWQRLESLGIREWLAEQQAAGRIGGVGFSYHGHREAFQQLVDAYPWDLCQIQYNYLDEHSQAGRKGLEYARAKGLPVIVMEPLRGGKLVELLPREAKAMIRRNPRRYSAAEWGLRWLWDQEAVTCVLSGMNSLAMVKENCRVADQVRPGGFTAEDFALIEGVKEAARAATKAACTGCGYCMPCPRNVDIPGTFTCYNAMYAESPKAGRKDYLRCTALRKRQSSASFCAGCGKCESRCPQGLPVRRLLAEAAGELETPYYRLVRWAVKRFGLW